MAEFKFACLHCGQKIEVDELWTGHELQCPICHKNLTVPPNPAAMPAPRPPIKGAHAAPMAPGVAPAAVAASAGFAGRSPSAAAPGRLAMSTPADTAMGRGTVAPAAMQRQAKQRGKGGSSSLIKIAMAAGVVVVLAVGGYFGYGLVSKWQEKANKGDSNQSGGGQVSHINGIYNALDATDPDRIHGKGRLPPPEPTAQAGQTPGQPGGKDLPPPQPVTWTLDVAAAKIPEGRASGMLSGTNFVVDNSRVDTVGAAQVLSLRQGTGPTADREILIYLHLNAGANLAGQKLTISKDMKGSAAPQVIKRWKVDPRYAPRSQTYAGGYAMKLELGAMGNGSIPGKIYLALPDQEQSVVGGLFEAVIGVPVAAAQMPAAPAPAPMRKVPTAGRTSDVEKRYGIQ